MVETQRKASHDYYSELCAKTEAYEALRAHNNQLEAKVGQLREVRDLQDELDQANLNLSKTEKSLERYKSEVELLRGHKDQVAELEIKLKDYDLTHSKLHEYREVSIHFLCETIGLLFVLIFSQRVDKMNLTLLEKTSTLNEINVAHQTVQTQLKAKSTELENLLQQNREVRDRNCMGALEKADLDPNSNYCSLPERSRSSFKSAEHSRKSG